MSIRTRIDQAASDSGWTARRAFGAVNDVTYQRGVDSMNVYYTPKGGIKFARVEHRSSGIYGRKMFDIDGAGKTDRVLAELAST